MMGEAMLSKNSESETKFLRAAEAGDVLSLEALLAGGVDKNVASDRWFEATSELERRARERAFLSSLIKLMIEPATMPVGMLGEGSANEEPTVDVKSSGRTAAMWAAGNGQVRALSALLSAGADVDRKDGRGWTAAMHASAKGHGVCVELLASAGCDLEARDCDALSALDYAAKHGWRASLEACVRGGSKLDAKGAGGATALMWAAFCDQVDCLEALARAGAGLDERNGKSHTAAMIAAFVGSRECLEALVAAGCDVSLVDDEGFDAEGHARQKGFLECADFLGSQSAKFVLERVALSGAPSALHAKTI